MGAAWPTWVEIRKYLRARFPQFPPEALMQWMKDLGAGTLISLAWAAETRGATGQTLSQSASPGCLSLPFLLISKGFP